MPEPKRSPAANNSKVVDQDIVRAQAKMIATKRIMGTSVDDIASEFKMSKDTVKSRIQWAKRHGLVEDFLDTVLDQLVPEAIKTYLLAIQNGDVDAARDVMFGTGVLQKNPKTGVQSTASVEMTIETYRNTRKDRIDIQTSLPAIEAGPSLRVSELPSAPETDAQQPAAVVWDFEGLTAGMGEDDDEDSR